MTERRPGEERKHSRVNQGASVLPKHAPGEDPVLGLQQLAGNRAVTELLATQPAADSPGSAGFRVRDLLRGSRPVAQAAVQRDTFAAWDEKAGSGEKAAWDEKAGSGEKAAWDEKAGSGEKAGSPAGATPTLAVGSAGPAVARLQALLAGAGFALTVDGSFGPRVRAAVLSFQASQGLAADGMVGRRTWGALEAPGTAKAAGATGALVAVGEMGLQGEGPGMDSADAAGQGAGEASLPDEQAIKKEFK